MVSLTIERVKLNWNMPFMITKLNYFSNLFSILAYSKIRLREVCELLGFTILSTCLISGFVASLAIILVVHDYSKLKISLANPTEHLVYPSSPQKELDNESHNPSEALLV